MTAKVGITARGIDKINHVLTVTNEGRSFQGEFLGGLSNGLATGFQNDALIPELAAGDFTPARRFVASVGGDLATPVAYWLQRHPIRLRVGSVTAAAVPATSGFQHTISQTPTARGVLRLALADIDDAAQILLDQSTHTPIPCGTKTPWDVYFHVANVTNGDILASLGYAELGVASGAVAVDPTAVINAAALVFKIAANKIDLVSVATTATVVATRALPSGDFVLSMKFDPYTRTVSCYVDSHFLGGYVLPTAVTGVGLAGRVTHSATYTALGAAPLGVDLDGVIVNIPVSY